jgi:hypothetical protein
VAFFSTTSVHDAGFSFNYSTHRLAASPPVAQCLRLQNELIVETAHAQSPDLQNEHIPIRLASQFGTA